MCTVVSGDCGCHGSGGADIGAIAVAVAGLAAAGLAYRVIATAPWVFVALWLLLLGALWAPSRRLALRAVKFLAQRGWRQLRRRYVKPATALEPAAGAAGALRWHVDLFAIAPGGVTTLLGSAVVAGEWPNAEALQTEAIQRWVAAHGLPTGGGTVSCQAKQVAGLPS